MQIFNFINEACLCHESAECLGYQSMGLKTILWTAALSVGMVALWKWLGSTLLLTGLPVLRLPFNLVMVGTFIVFPWFRWTRTMVIPIKVVTSSTEERDLWLAKV